MAKNQDRARASADLRDRIAAFMADGQERKTKEVATSLRLNTYVVQGLMREMETHGLLSSKTHKARKIYRAAAPYVAPRDKGAVRTYIAGEETMDGSVLESQRVSLRREPWDQLQEGRV